MNPDRNNDSSVLFRWKEFSMSLNLTAKEFKQGELFIRETIRSRRKIVNFLFFSTRSDGTAWKEKCTFPQWYKRNILSIKSISGKPWVFDRLPLVYRWLYFSGSNGTCRSASFCICNFAQVITAAYLPRIFMANTRVNVFTDEKSRLAGHIILRNEISRILIELSFRTQSGCYISCPTVHFGCSFQIIKLILVNPRGLTDNHWHFDERIHYSV